VAEVEKGKLRQSLRFLEHISDIFGYSIPVVPHKAVAEVSKIGNL
jgi:hypothetical protein